MRTKYDILTLQEKEILSLIARSYSNAEISAKLYISISTVKNIISDICTKLNANGRVHASVIAVRRGIIDFD